MKKPCSLFILCTEGELEIDFGFRTERLLGSDGFLVSTDEQVSVCACSETVEFFWFEFTKEACLVTEKATSHHGCCFAGCIGLIQPALELYQKALRHEMATIFANSRTAHAFLIEVVSQLISTAQEPGDWVTEARKYMEAHYQESSIGLDSIAEEMKVSKYHLCREFKNRFGLSPGQYLKELRLQEAVRLLKEKREHSIEQIARATGYANGSYFGKVFRKNFGMSPDEFRKKISRYDIVEDLNLPAKNRRKKQ